MVKRIVFVLAIGALALLGAPSAADAQCGGCAPPVFAPPQNCCYQQPIYLPPPPPPPPPMQTCCQPAPVQTSCCQQQQSYCGGGSLFGGLFGGWNRGCQSPQPIPVYIVNQGPVYSGPNVMTAPAPYAPYGMQQPYPYVGGNVYNGGYYSGGPYADPYRHRVRTRVSYRVRYYQPPRYHTRRPPPARVIPMRAQPNPRWRG